MRGKPFDTTVPGVDWTVVEHYDFNPKDIIAISTKYFSYDPRTKATNTDNSRKRGVVGLIIKATLGLQFSEISKLLNYSEPAAYLAISSFMERVRKGETEYIGDIKTILKKLILLDKNQEVREYLAWTGEE